MIKRAKQLSRVFGLVESCLRDLFLSGLKHVVEWIEYHAGAETRSKKRYSHDKTAFQVSKYPNYLISLVIGV